MLRLFRHLRTGAVWVALLLCLAAAGDWANSYRRCWVIINRSGHVDKGVASDSGAFYFSRLTPSLLDEGMTIGVQPAGKWDAERAWGSTTRQRWKPIRLISRGDFGNGIGIQIVLQIVIIPHRVIVTLLAIPPMVRFRAWRRRCRASVAGDVPDLRV
jgi:hypothetical protein